MSIENLKTFGESSPHHLRFPLPNAQHSGLLRSSWKFLSS